MILTSRVAFVEYIGLARAIEHEVSVAVPGTLANVLVDMFEDVEKGQLVALLDDRQVAATLAVAAAELSVLTRQQDAALGATANSGAVSGATVGWMSERRRFDMDVENRRLEALALRLETRVVAR